MSGLLGLRLISKIPRLSSNIRLISTSNKKSDVTTAAPGVASAEACEIKKEKRHWQSYGFNYRDETDDLNRMHSHGFFFISLGLCFGSFILVYRPDVSLDDWSHREAFLEIRRREQLGLPLIDPNYADPAQIILPTDEELGDIEIII